MTTAYAVRLSDVNAFQQKEPLVFQFLLQPLLSKETSEGISKDEWAGTFVLLQGDAECINAAVTLLHMRLPTMRFYQRDSKTWKVIEEATP
jgi:hypothetical protein